ncbi:XopAC/AvrAC family type III secretion system effector [Paracidovorax konjaci]|uniref:Uncharacterized protein n=1 Tax=Paracidovorax konjaci TaxID=32040 RepID=A0A1I1W425_9BURK|nr:XopAC/AvrAC family type III secretion system effector [Paracidovorax konjaci]SFD89851.1 hypothetical protein SAMN04489710_108101 [Paracidovorax konjaci]
MTSTSLSVPFGAPILSFMPPESGRAPAAAAPRARTAAAANGLHRWYEALQAWCDADPGRVQARAPSAASGGDSAGLWGRLAARVNKPGAGARDDLMEGFAGRCKEFALAAARGTAFDGGTDDACSERREIAVGRLLLAYEAQADALDLCALGLTTLPPGLELLGTLEHLDLSRNSGLRQLPAVLERCKALRVLAARQCGLSAVAPEVFALPGLAVLDLSGNADLRSLPPEAAQAPALRELHAAHCQLGSLPEGLHRIATLELADLSCNPRLQELPAGWNPADARLRVQGTPLELMAGVLRPLPLTPRQRGTLAEHLDALVCGWPALQDRMHADRMFAQQVDLLRGSLSLAVRSDWMGTQEAGEDAAHAVAGWLRESQPITTARLLELGWRINCRPAGADRLRTHEAAPAAAPAAPAAAPAAPAAAPAAHGRPRAGDSLARPAAAMLHPEAPAAATLPAHLAALEAWAAQGDPSRVALDPLAAMERAVLLYRALVSLRPLDKGNEPAALAAMDWALQQHGLPPVLLPDDPALPVTGLFSAGRVARGDTAAELLQEVVRHMDAVVVRLAPRALALAA